MNTARSLTLGLSVGFLAATVAVVGDLLGWFNCVSAWLIETVVLTLCLAVAVRRFRTVTIGGSVVFAYITIIAYVVIHAHRSGRWLSDDWTPVFASFFFFVVLPIIFARALDLTSLRHARDEASRSQPGCSAETL
jgi:hypothetical protein